LKYSCDVYFYQVALRTGIDRISAMAHRLGMGTELDIDIPGQRIGQVPTKDWRVSKGHPWQLGDTVVSGIGQGYIVVSPLQLGNLRGADRHRPSHSTPFSPAGSRAPCNRDRKPERLARPRGTGTHAGRGTIRHVRGGK